tara:strand:- start:318 stop:503 length:186 start_codon:yes stop_codon:yes gene_type:complete
MWLKLLVAPVVLWFIYLFTMMIWNTISPGTPLKFYEKNIRPLYYTPPVIVEEPEEEDFFDE